MTMPHPHHLQALLSEQGFIALKEGLITPQDALKFGENSSLYLMELCTEKGISALRDAKNQGGSVLEDTIKAYVKHAHEYNNVGALEHSLKNGIPINQVQQTIKDNEPRSGLR